MPHADEGLREYQGLVTVTARKYARACGMEADDLAQLLWLKVWQLRLRYDAARSALPEERYVFGGLKNRVKDLIRDNNRLVRREGPPPLPMATADQSDLEMWVGAMVVYRERFEERYLSTGQDQVFGGVDEGLFVLPSTITRDEARVIVLLMRGYTQRDIAEELDVPRKHVKSHQDSIVQKLRDWAPDVPTPEPLLTAA